MKQLLTTLSVFILFTANSQSIKNNNIGEVKTLNIYGSNAKVAIGQVIINETYKTRLFLESIKQNKDSLGIFHTIFSFTNPERQINGLVKIDLIFDKPILKVNSGLASYVCMQQNEGYLQDYKGYQFKCGSITAESLVFEVTSKTLVFTTIGGIEGKLN